MKQRITYLVKDPENFSPEQLQLKDGSLRLREVNAAKEHRITFGLDELPKELSKSFEQWHELHIRWASERAYSAPPPFTSRVTPGLHVFFTPHKDQPEGQLCDSLHSVFGPDLKCSSTNESSTKLPILSGRFSMSASSQYYSYLPSLSNLVSYIQKEICSPSHEPCETAASSLLSASYLDIDYDTISHAVILNAFWNSDNDAWTETIAVPSKYETIEVGVLNYETNPDPEDIAFSGFLTVLGKDTSPKPTRFQTPTRHYPLPPASSKTTPLSYTAAFVHPTGLHPILHLAFPTPALTPPNPTCKLHTHLTLPSYLFIDKYQFSDPLSLASHHLTSLRSIAGATDLEAPDWVIPQWGSAALFELAIPLQPPTEAADGDNTQWNVSIPLHLRYLPAAPTSHAHVPVPWPVVFWACRAEEGTKMSNNPFDRRHLGYEALFGPKTRFMHVPPAREGNGTGTLAEWVDVPVLDLRRTGWVEAGTVGTVVVAFLALCWVLFGRVGAGGGGGRKMGGKVEGKKKQ